MFKFLVVPKIFGFKMCFNAILKNFEIQFISQRGTLSNLVSEIQRSLNRVKWLKNCCIE